MMYYASVTFVLAAFSAFVGLIHAPGVSINAAPTYSVLYLILGAVFAILALLGRKGGKQLAPLK